MLYRRLVIKLGTALLTGGGDRLNPAVMSSLVDQIAQLHHRGADLIIVSSGAIAAGKHRLGPIGERKDIPFKQVLAAVGQSHLMYAYEQLFSWYGIVVAQALLTRNDFSDRLRYLNARNTLLSLLELKVIPIVNENDVVAVEELEGTTFGDNDNLSAMVAALVDADLLAILTDIPGLFTADPHHHPEAKLIPRVERITPEIERWAEGASRPQSRGGMVTKIQAAKLATASGIPVVIADGRERDVLLRIAAGEALGTLFTPTSERLESRRRWLLSAPIRGRLFVDEGAKRAITANHSSLLPVGIKKVSGDFRRGDVVAVVDLEGNAFACGITNYSSEELERIKGLHSKDIDAVLGYEYGEEVIHRNNMALL